MASGGPLSQDAVDGVFSFRTLRDVKESIGELPKGLQEGTLEKIIETLRSLGTPVTCEETAASAGIAPATVRRYLGHLVQKNRVSIDLEYHATGRPVNRYRLRELFSDAVALRFGRGRRTYPKRKEEAQ